MHDDGSVSEISVSDEGDISYMIIRLENILKVLHHYRPFEEVF